MTNEITAQTEARVEALGDDALQAIETAEAQAEAYEGQDTTQAVDQAPAEVLWQDSLDSVSDSEIQTLNANLALEFTERARYERDKNTSNINIQKTLSKLQASFSKPGASRVLCMTGTGSTPINLHEVADKRRNVYALDKMADLLYGSVMGGLKNAVNRANIASMVKCEAAGIPFSGAVSKAATSDKIAVDAQLKGLLVRHTVAESTASTQSSSTMTALEDLGCVKNVGSRQYPVYQMQDTALMRRLIEVTRSLHGVAAA